MKRSEALLVSRRSRGVQILSLMCTFGLIRGMAADGTTIEWDWTTRTASCPPKVTASTKVTLTLTGINDVIIDFASGDRLVYQVRAKATPVSVVPENLFNPQAGKVSTKTACTSASVRRHLDEAAAAVIAAKNPKLSPPSPGGRSIPVDESVAAARSIREVAAVEQEMGDSACESFFTANDPVVQWLKRLEGSHSASFNLHLEPNLNYVLTVDEMWKGRRTDGMEINCGENDIVSLSIGPLVTWMPYRTYDHQKAPVPAGGATTADILTVSGNGNPSLMGAALLNFHLPNPRWVPQSTGVAISVGPVFKFGDAPGVSSLGLFVGGSIHLYRSMFLTPGMHIGEFADFPAGFYPGAKIPDQFGNLTPIKRTSAHFAVGITFKATTFKKSSQAGGTAKNTTAATDTNNQKPAAQPVGGNKGAGGDGK